MQPRFQVIGHLDIVAIGERYMGVSPNAEFRQKDDAGVAAMPVDGVYKLPAPEAGSPPKTIRMGIRVSFVNSATGTVGVSMAVT